MGNSVSCLLLALLSLAPRTAAAGEPRTDAYGDPLPDGARYRLGTTRFGHPEAVRACAWAPDGKTLATADAGGTVRLWHFPAGTELRRREMRSRAAFCLAFSQDGKALAGGGPGEGAWLWDLSTSRVRPVGEPEADVRDLAFSPDGKCLVVAADRILCWDAASGKRVDPPNLGMKYPHRLAFSPDGKTLAATDGGDETQLWAWPGGTPLRRLCLTKEEFPALAFAPDAKVLATGDSGSDLRLWDVGTGRQVGEVAARGAGPTDRVAFSPDGTILADVGRGELTFWELKPAAGPRPPLGLGHRAAHIALTAGGRELAVASLDGSLSLYDARDGRTLRALEGGGTVPAWLVPTPDGQSLAGGDSKAAYLWEVGTGRRRPLTKTPFAARCLAFSPDGDALAVGGIDGSFRLREAASGKELRRLERDAGTNLVLGAAWSSDGRLVAASHRGGELTLFDVGGGWTPLELQEEARLEPTLAFSPDGRLLAAAGRDRRVHLFEVVSRQRVGQFGDRICEIRSLAFSADGRTLAAGCGQPASTAPAWAIAQGPPFRVQMWDVASGEPLRYLAGHQGPVHGLAFTPDGRALVSASEDTTVLGWDAMAVTGRPRPAPLDLTAERLAALWAELGGDDAVRAQKAVAELMRSPRAVSFLEKALPPVPPVAAAERLASLIADLDHDEFVRRERAAGELEKLGELAVPAVRKALAADPSPEARRRLLEVLDAQDEQALYRNRVFSARGLQVLEAIGTPEARRVVALIARGASQALRTQEAKATLRRLEKRQVLQTQEKSP